MAIVKNEQRDFCATVGWYQISGRINWQVGRCAFRLEDQEKEKVYYELPVSQHGAINEIIFIKAASKRLRLAPAVPEVSYEILDIKLISAGFFKRWGLMLDRIVTTLLTQSRTNIAISGFRSKHLFISPHEVYRRFALFSSYTSPINYSDFPAASQRNRLTLGSEIVSHGVLVVCLGRMPESLNVEGLIDIQTVSLASLEQLFPFLEKNKTIRYLIFVDENVNLFPCALSVLIKRMLAVPEAGLVYSDHDEINESTKVLTPFFKPDWSPEMLYAQNYVGAVFGLNLDKIPARYFIQCRHLYEVLLRATAHIAPIKREGATVVHIQEILYRCPSKSEEVKRAELEALNGFFAERAIAATFEYCPPGFNKITYPVKGKPLVSIIIPTRDELHHLRRCIDSILHHTDYQPFEILIVDNQSRDPQTLEYLRKIAQHDQVSVLSYNCSFNFAAINNWAARQAKGDYLCFLNNDTEVISKGWLRIMLGQLMQPNVGAVGAKLLFANNTIQHIGDAVGVGEIAAHYSLGDSGDSPGYMMRSVIAQDVSAVTGACLLTSRSLYKTMGGFNEVALAVAYNDVDFCLRLGEAGYRVVMTPYAQLYHHESTSRRHESFKIRSKRHAKESRYMRNKWRHKMNGDPFYNSNLNPAFPDFSINEWYLLQQNRLKNTGLTVESQDILSGDK